MRQRFGLVCFVVLLGCGISLADDRSNASASEPDKFYFQFQGDMGGRHLIGMTLRLSLSSQHVSGCYFYARYRTEIRLEGERVGDSIRLSEFDANGIPTGIFSGTFNPQTPAAINSDHAADNVFAGQWSKPDGQGKSSFHLRCIQAADGTPPAHPYDAAGFKDEATADLFMAHLRTAIITHDGDAAAKLVHFPAQLNIDGKPRRFRSRAEFIRFFAQFCTEDYASRVRAACPFFLFARDQRVMLGQGLVWVRPSPSLSVDKDESGPPVIAAFNSCDTLAKGTDSPLPDK